MDAQVARQEAVLHVDEAMTDMPTVLTNKREVQTPVSEPTVPWQSEAKKTEQKVAAETATVADLVD